MVTHELTHRHYHTETRHTTYESDHQHINIRVVIFTAPHESISEPARAHRTLALAAKSPEHPSAANLLYTRTPNRCRPPEHQSIGSHTHCSPSPARHQNRNLHSSTLLTHHKHYMSVVYIMHTKPAGGDQNDDDDVGRFSRSRLCVLRVLCVMWP